jgi:rhamnogalacturonyl hydrolase YesR
MMKLGSRIGIVAFVSFCFWGTAGWSFEIESPREGADLHSREVLVLVEDCPADSSEGTPFFRVFLDGQVLPHVIRSPASVHARARAQKKGEHAFEVQIPRTTEAGSHRLTVEASCSGKAKSDSIRILYQSRSILEIAHGLALNGVIENRSDRTDWDFSHGLLALGLAELARVSNEPEAGLLRDWVQGYHLGWAQRSSAPKKLDTPPEVFPALSALVLEQDSFESVQAAATWLKGAPRNSSGLLDRRGTDFWRQGTLAGISAEDLLAYGVFAVSWARRQNDIELGEWAEKAPLLFAEHLWDAQSGFYHQTWLEWGKRVRNAGKSFHYRTQGSVLFALVSLLELIPEDSSQRDSLVRQANALATQLSGTQLVTGAWPLTTRELDLSSGESTTTALVGAAMARGVRLGVLDSRHLVAARKAWSFVLARVVELPEKKRVQARFSVDQAVSWPAPSRGLRCLKEDLPHTLGAVVLFASEWVRLGGRSAVERRAPGWALN